MCNRVDYYGRGKAVNTCYKDGFIRKSFVSSPIYLLFPYYVII